MTMSGQSTIFEAAVGCRQAFKAATEQPRLMVSEWAENRMADFNLWCVGAGAFTQERTSLEYRLRTSPHILKTIINLLLMLKILIEDCIEAQPDKSISATMNDVQVNLNQLTRLVHAIRKAGAWSRLQKADSSFNADSSELRALSQHLQVVLCAEAEQRGTSLSASQWLDSARLQLTPIQTRLVDANLRRRNRFLYAQRHAMKLENNTRAPRAMQPMVFHEVVRPLHPHYAETPNTHADSERHYTTQSTTTATNVEGPIVLPQRQAMPPTTVLSATSSKVDYPKPPPIADKRTVFTCPCCCQSLPTLLSKGSQWKKHLMEDILPYTCILENCPKPDTFYMTKESWLEHMSSDHDNAPQWTCRACSQKNIHLTFYSAEDLKAHLEGNHRKGVKTQLIPALLSAWQQKMPLQVSSCPLCIFTADDRTDILGHIAEHVHAFSLRSLPWAPSEQPDGVGERDRQGAYFRDHPYFEVRSSQSELSSDASETLPSDKDAQDLPALEFNTPQYLVHGSEHLELTEDLLKEVPHELPSVATANTWLADLDLAPAEIPEAPSPTRSETFTDEPGPSGSQSKGADDHFAGEEDSNSRNTQDSNIPADYYPSKLLPLVSGRSSDLGEDDDREAFPTKDMKRRMARLRTSAFPRLAHRTPVYENYAEFFYPEELRAGKAERQSPTMPNAVETELVLPLDSKIDKATGDISWPVPELKLVGPSRSISWGVPEVKVFEPDPDSATEADSKAGATRATKAEPDIEDMSPEPVSSSKSAGRRKPLVHDDYAQFFYPEELRTEAQPQSGSISMPTTIEPNYFTHVEERTSPDRGPLPWPIPELKISEADSGLTLDTESTARALSPEAQ